LFAAMGFYPVNPASGEYMIGSPLYRGIALKLENGRTFRIEARNNSEKNIYIQSATLNSRPLDIPVVTWDQIQSGATLVFQMGPNPSQWADGWRPAPVPVN
jgi:putative alpha-1,2-mannosidase